MDHLHLEATAKTPLIDLDPVNGRLEIRGCSIHENAEAFFDRIYSSVEDYAASPAPLTEVVISLEYFNSSSAKYLLDILQRLDDLHAGGGSKVSVAWNYAEGDLDMLEAGNDYKAMLGMPVKLQAHKS